MAPSPSPEKVNKAKETLCITEPTNSERGVDVAYKFLSRKCHQDSKQKEETEVTFKEIVNARDILKKAAEENVGDLKKIWKLAKEAAAKKRENYKKEQWKELVAGSGPPPERHNSSSRTNTVRGLLLGSGTSELVPFKKKGNGSEKKSSHTDRHHERHGSHTNRERGEKGSNRKEHKELAVVRHEEERPRKPDANEKRKKKDEKRKKEKEDEDRKERLKTIMKEYDKKVKKELEEHIKKQYASKAAKKEEVPTPSNRPKPQEQQNNSRSTSPDRQSTGDSSDTSESEESEDADELDINSEEYATWYYDHYNNQQAAHPHSIDASTSSQTGGYSRLPMNLTAEQTRDFLGMGMGMGMPGYSRTLPLGDIKDGDTSGQVARR